MIQACKHADVTMRCRNIKGLVTNINIENNVRKKMTTLVRSTKFDAWINK